MATKTLECENPKCKSIKIKTNDPQGLINFMKKATVRVEGECLDCGHRFQYSAATNWGMSSGRIMY